MPLSFITGNPLKYAEVAAVIPGIIRVEVDLPELQELDAKPIIEAKLAAAVSHGIYPVMVEDTSLELEVLNGLPGPLIKWFLQAVGVAGVFEMARLQGNTKAIARTVIGVALTPGDFKQGGGSPDTNNQGSGNQEPSNQESPQLTRNSLTRHYFEGTVHGQVVAPRGPAFGWNEIFQPNGSALTFAEMSDSERLSWSMRRIAAERLNEFLIGLG